MQQLVDLEVEVRVALAAAAGVALLGAGAWLASGGARARLPETDYHWGESELWARS